MAKWIKNNSGITKTYVGQQILDQEYYQIQADEEIIWANHSPLLTDIGNGDTIVASNNSGTEDILDIATAINHLKDENPIKIDPNTSVHTFALSEGDSMRARLVGIFNQTITKNQISNLDWLIPQTKYLGTNKQAYMDGIEYYADDSEIGDKITFQVIDKDNVLGYGANTILDEFGKNWAVMPNQNTIRLYKAKLIPGVYIRLEYTSVGTINDIKFICNLFRHMDTDTDI